MKLKSKLLIIAGSDSSGGAGIQADIKTATSLGVYAMTAITAITAQNTTGVKSIVPVPPKEIFNQISFSVQDIKPNSVKIGMLHNVGVIKEVIKAIKKHKLKNIVIDPVMVAKGGHRLISNSSINYLRKKLLPFAQSEDELEGVIERLLKKDLLSNERFTENLVLRKAARYGARRIAQELGQHQIASETIVQELKQLQDSEDSRAYVVWEHKFGEISSDPKEQARQMRFLAQRGFGHELIMRIIKGKSRSSSS